MEIKILQVFLGADGLPYKDSDRSVHFPIVGSSFQGASNTTQIKFYFDRLGSIDTTWVATAKLPNGKIGSKVLNNMYDSTLGENYALLELDSFYFQYKGDVFVSLQGYQGGVQVSYDSESELYTITGTPTIQATGSIKFAVNYATQFVGSGEEENVTLQELLATIGTKLNSENGVYCLTYNVSGKTIANLYDYIVASQGDDDLLLLNISGYSGYNGAYIGRIQKSDNKYYFEFERYTSGVRAAQDRWVARDLTGSELITSIIATYNQYHCPYLVNGNVIDYDTATFQDLFDAIGGVPHIIRLTGSIPSDASLTYGGYFLIKINDSGAFLAERLTPSSTPVRYQGTITTWSTPLSDIFKATSQYYKPLALKSEVDTKQDELVFDNEPTAGSTNPVTSEGILSYVQSVIATITSGEFVKVDTTEYPTLEDFLDSTGEEGHIYLYPINLLDLTQGYYQYIWEESDWIDIGTTQIDLSNYVTQQQIANYLTILDAESDYAQLGQPNVFTATQNMPALQFFTFQHGLYGNLGPGSSLGELVYTDGSDTPHVVAYTSDLTGKENTSNKVTSISGSSTDTQYPSAKCVYDVTQDIREVAEGKCKTFILSYQETIANVKSATSGQYPSQHFYVWNETTKEYEDKTAELQNGDYDNISLANGNFNSQTQTIADTTTYLIFRSIGALSSYSGNDFYMVYLQPSSKTSAFKPGDIFLVIETNVPDRWYGYGTTPYNFYKLETLNYENLYLKNNNLIPNDTYYDIGSSSRSYRDLYLSRKISFSTYYYIEKTTSGLKISATEGILTSSIIPIVDNTYNLGSSAYKWKDIYLAGSLKDGTYSYTIEDSYRLLYGAFQGDYPLTELTYEYIMHIQVGNDTTFTYKTAPTNCTPEYRAKITNGGSSNITITLPSGTKILTNDEDNVQVSSNTFVLTTGTTVEISIVDSKCVAVVF